MTEETFLHLTTLIVLGAAIVPLLLAVFFYVTKPSGRFYRVYTRAWTRNPISVQIVAQKTILAGLLSFILLIRFIGEFPGRNIIAYTLYGLLVLAFWSFFIIERRIQKPHEAERKAQLTADRKTHRKESHNDSRQH